MAENNRLVSSILLSTGLLLAFQLAVFFVVSARQALEEYALGFLLTTVAVHLVLLSFLLLMRDDFSLVPSGRPLRRVNVANLLSMFRISSTPSILFYLILSREYATLRVLLVFTGIAFLTDLFDGFLSRRLGQVTRIGRYLDSISDYGILLVVCFAIYHFDLISDWFFVLVLIRFLGQGIGMGALLLYHGSVESRSTFLGKVAVFATMVTFGLSLLQLLPSISERMERVVRTVEYPVAFFLVVSLLEKLLLLRNGFRRARREQRRKPAEHQSL
ncbi:MAG: CDP-alcohol phosphatidyltransferase family protein [Spirochaetaceae bacterium]